MIWISMSKTRSSRHKVLERAISFLPVSDNTIWKCTYKQTNWLGTSGDDVYYKSPKGAQVQFYGACSKDTPCIGNEVVAWQQGKWLTAAAPDMEIDFSGYDYDVVFTLTDTSVTTEQYVVRADGKEVGTTHGRLSLGEDKYNTKHIAETTNVGGGAPGALKSIANDGFWGSFRIPKGG